jgi:hypothetical protein
MYIIPIRYEGSAESEERIATAGSRMHREPIEWILDHAFNEARNEGSRAALYVVPRGGVSLRPCARATPQ